MWIIFTSNALFQLQKSRENSLIACYTIEKKYCRNKEFYKMFLLFFTNSLCLQSYLSNSWLLGCSFFFLSCIPQISFYLHSDLKSFSGIFTILFFLPVLFGHTVFSLRYDAASCPTHRIWGNLKLPLSNWLHSVSWSRVWYKHGISLKTNFNVTFTILGTYLHILLNSNWTLVTGL